VSRAGASTPSAKTATKTTSRKPKAKPETSVANEQLREDMPAYRIGEPVVDPIGDTTDGEGHAYTGGAAISTHAEAHAEMNAFREDTNIQAWDSADDSAPEIDARRAKAEAGSKAPAHRAEPAGKKQAREPQDPAKLERLQKILSQAGVASRRRAEEMIVAGRVMVNGEVVTTLGSKADPARDHIRVDGKLLHGAERHRYFLLNKPRGYVTTVSDPESRPTVMEFFGKSRERLYPVGRLDYQSEGLLLMTNDGELANLLTKAGSGVEKTYLVKVAGQPSEAELERLRGGVEIDREEQGSERVRTAPARVRQVRSGDNPWFEVVLIEGRNRELRKMFSAVGHFVEKIKRVGYGPLLLDVEPGKMRELAPEEVNTLRLAAEGKLKPKRLHADRMLPKDAGQPAGKRFEKPFGRQREGTGERGGKGFARREPQSAKREWRPREPDPRQPNQDGGFRRSDGPALEIKREGTRPFGEKPSLKRPEFGGAPRGGRGISSFKGQPSKPFNTRERGPREHEARGAQRDGGFRRSDRPTLEIKREAARPFGEKPSFKRPEFGGAPPRDRGSSGFKGGAPKPFNTRERATPDRGPRGPQQDSGFRRSDGPALEIKREGARSFGEKPPFKRPEYGGGPRRNRNAAGNAGGARKPFVPGGDRPAFRPGGAKLNRFGAAPGRSFARDSRGGRPPSQNAGRQDGRQGGNRGGAKRFGSRPSGGRGGFGKRG
jgi:23S rRNA pseudouridine2605 synthase